MARFEVVGINDKRDYCECCGKKNLARVVWIRDTETDEVKHFGTVCAQAPAKGFNLRTEIKAEISKFDRRERAVNYMAMCEYKKRGGKYVAHPTESGRWTAENKESFAAVRAEINARNDFNY